MATQRTETVAAVQGKWLPVRSTTFVSRTEWVRSEQRAAGRKACFMTQERLHCRNGDCEWRRECRRLVAAWKR